MYLVLSSFLIRCLAGWTGVGVVVDGQAEAVLVEEVMAPTKMKNQNHLIIAMDNHSLLQL